MLAHTLRRLDEVFAASGPPIGPQEWNVHLDEFACALSRIADRLLRVAKLSVPGRLFGESKHELLATRTPAIVVCEYRLRPRSSYYKQVRKAIPRPENPRGPDATGLEVSLVLCRGYQARTAIRRPSFSIELCVWGSRERGGFRKLLIEHKRLVELLMSRADLTVQTACPFENVDRARRASAYEKLLLYYENEDAECNFTLEAEFGEAAREADLLKSLLPLLALYDAALGYCLPRSSTDRVLDYVSLVHDS